MIKLMKSSLAAMLCAAALSVQATPAEDARALVDEAVSLLKAKGKDAAVAEINAGGHWHRDGRYVVAVQYDGLMVAHSAVPKIVGKNMLGAKDAGGKEFVRETIAAVKSKGSNQMDLRWSNPETKKIADAVFVTKAVPGMDIYVGSIVFK